MRRKKNDELTVEIHVLRSVPFNCANRDDIGSPKTGIYGGVKRSRRSSQSRKYPARQGLRHLYESEEIEDRTKYSADMVAEKILELVPGISVEKAEKEAVDAVKRAGLTVNEKKGNTTNAVFMISDTQAMNLARLKVDGVTDKASYHDALIRDPSMGEILFGRMYAGDETLKYDACLSVADAVSTHSIRNEQDPFTTIDDRAPRENSGAAHMSFTEFNSSTYYEYATIDVMGIAKHFNHERTAEGVAACVDMFIKEEPRGRVHSHANLVAPDFINVTFRTDGAANLVGAFEIPVSASDKGYMGPSVEAYEQYAKSLYNNMIPAPIESYVVKTSKAPCSDDLGKIVTKPELISIIEKRVIELLDELDPR